MLVLRFPCLLGPATHLWALQHPLIGSPAITDSPCLLTFAGQTYTPTPNNGAFVIQGQTVTPGGAITVAETRKSLAPTAAYAVVGASTIPLQGNSPDFITFAGSTYKPTSGSFTIGGQTSTPGVLSPSSAHLYPCRLLLQPLHTL